LLSETSSSSSNYNQSHHDSHGQNIGGISEESKTDEDYRILSKSLSKVFNICDEGANTRNPEVNCLRALHRRSLTKNLLRSMCFKVDQNLNISLECLPVFMF
jgi:hypothetical protein